MRYFSRLELLGGLIVGAAAISACSLVYDLSDDQCEINPDCDALGGEFVGRECRAGVCVPRGNTGGGGGGGGPGGCTTGQECLDQGDDMACVEGACVNLTSTECPQVIPIDYGERADLLGPNGPPVIFGAFAEMKMGTINTYTRNFDLAFNEFNGETDGFGTAPKRPLIAVVCHALTEDEADQDASIDAAMAHLTGTLKVPGVISALQSQFLRRAFNQTDPMSGPFFLSALETDNTLAALDDNGRVWQLLPGGEEIAIAYRPLLERTLEFLDLDEPARVALVVADDIPATQDMGATILTDDPNKPDLGIRFNGQGITDNLADGSFLGISIKSFLSDPEPEVTAAETADQLIEFRPHVIIGASAFEFFDILTAIETRWDDEVGADVQPRPFYLLSPYHTVPGVFRPAIQANRQARSRIAGLNSAAAEDRTLYNSYLTRYKLAYPEDMAPENYENFYDAPYYMIYAARAVFGISEFNGQALATGMTRLLSGADHEVGRSDMNSAISDLTNAGRIRLHGTLGPPDFTLRGGRSTPASVWCIDAETNLRPDVLKYDPATKELVYGKDAEGEPLTAFPCIPGF